MQFIRGFGMSEAEYVKKHAQSEPYQGQERIAKYLDEGELMLASPMFGYDAITGEKIVSPRMILTDGEYSWENTLPHYVRKYNVRLPREFERKILCDDSGFDIAAYCLVSETNELPSEHDERTAYCLVERRKEPCE